MYESESDADPYQSWEPCFKLKRVPLVKGSSVMNPNLGLPLLTYTCPPTDNVEGGMLMVKGQGLRVEALWWKI